MLKRRLSRKIKRAKRNLTSKTDVTLKSRKLTIDVEKRSSKIINLVGYVILILVLLDYIFLLASSQIFDSAWAYNTAGSLVENVWGVMLALVLVFHRRDQEIIKPKESFFLKIISWLTLAMGIAYFMIIPVIIGGNFRLNRNNQAQITRQIDVQKNQVQVYNQNLQQANPEQLNSLLKQYETEQNSPIIDIGSTEEIKHKLLEKAKQTQKLAEEQLLSEFSKQKTNLFKQTTKWSIGAIISGMCFVLIWRQSKWARKI